MALLATVAIQLSWIASLMVGRDVVTDTYPLHQHSPADRARKLFPLALLLLITVFALFSPRFFQFQNMMIIMQQAVVLLVTALGMTFIIIAGSIDLGGLSDLGPP